MELQNAVKAAFEKVKEIAGQHENLIGGPEMEGINIWRVADPPFHLGGFEVLAFLDKVKEKKLRKEKEDLVVSLKVFMGKYEKYLTKGEGSPEDESEYIDTGVENEPENYDDVETKHDNLSEIYVDTSADAGQDDEIYEDAAAGEPVKQSPSHATIPPIACDKLTNASTADFLDVKRDEKSVIRGSWVKRWCVIHRNIFYMYENSSDKKQKDAFELTNCQVNMRDSVSKETKRKERCFEVVTVSGKIYEFCAHDRDGVGKWKCYIEQARSLSGSQLTPPDNSTVSPSPSHNAGKKMMNLFKLKKKKNQDPSDTIGSVSVDDQEVYVDTAEGTDEVYMDTEANDGEIYNDVEEHTPEVKPAFPLPARDLKPSAATTPLPVVPGDRDLPLLPPSSGDFGNSSPVAPPRPKKSFKNESLPPPPPPSDDIRTSGSGSFSHRIPPTPHNQEQQFNSLPPAAVHHTEKPLEQSEVEAEDEAFIEIDISELYQGMWDCSADEANELSFKRGQIVHIVSKEYDQYGWWIGKRKDEIGFVPKDYLMEAYEIR